MTKLGAAAASAALCAVLAGCGEGGGKGTVVTPAPTPTLDVTLSASSQTMTVGEDLAGTLGFDATVAGTSGEPIVADVQYDHGALVLDGVTKGADGKYQVRLHPASALALGDYSGTITFRLCREAGCATVYPGSAKTFTYQLTVQLADWTTFQRNASHNGFINASFQPSDFQKAWEWTQPGTTNVSTVASQSGLTYFTTRDADGTSSVRAVASATGAQTWSYSLGQVYSSSAPAIGNGRLFVTTMVSSSDENAIVAIDPKTGQYAGPNALFSSQWSNFLAPTPFEDGLYMSAGYYGNVVYGYDYSSLTYWSNEVQGYMWDGQTPAVDAQYVYYYSGAGIEVIDRKTGAIQKRMVDPFFQRDFYDYYGAPILGTKGNVVAYSGTRDAGSPSVLVNWSMATGAYAWRSAESYTTTPAVGGGFVYLARNDPGRLDALSEDSGVVQWSWTPPSGERFLGNTIASRNLVFVATDKAVYAIPTEGSSHAPVWSAPTGGAEIAITAEGVLVMVKAPEQYYNPTTLVAYRLK
ncbi:PQQ-binding-like beta-propeller repeat protein [Sphingomonas sp. PL-96]|uniref:outer membrane protein assembly factor BamB family protein n=1 Tax=Sphingomonas sp. PL-96 TaxID=2887201 RepID=UPI001E345A74|nr:PQQ-binding-like beta-propeller repeat protein [Sphingomonas sp. PL-96]MCC2975413.1 PQQ-binding-like beta-propeller repeat protein [Sphingomonas sp. PL-96]